MSEYNETTALPTGPDYEYGNHSPIEVVRIVPIPGKSALDPHASLEYDDIAVPLFTEAELETKVTEIADNYQIIGDPKSSESSPKQFGITIANKHLLELNEPAILVMSTSGSSLYDEKGNPNNEGNALELAYTAFAHPDKPIVYVESPGNGNSVDLMPDEYASATYNGKLVDETRYGTGRIVDFEAFETMKAMARALADSNIAVSHVSSNATGAHFSTALMAALPQNSVERAFLYNPSNISDRSWLGLTLGNLKEIAMQGKYAKASKDPLKLTDERKQMAQRVMSSLAKRKIDQVRASTHNPAKLSRQQKIFRHGNKNGQSAAAQVVVAQMRHRDIKQTAIFPEFATQYKNPAKDFPEFMGNVAVLGGRIIEVEDLESLKIPLGQYGHSHYPTVRGTLEGYAFNR